MSKWQPIRTAPRDEWVLLYGGGVYDLAKFENGGWFTALLRPSPHWSFIRPTHWQPLPEPPENPT